MFTVNNNELGRLNPYEAVDFFRELLWAEAWRLGVSKTLINVPSAITVADGGIDAEVKNADITGGHGIIKQGLTRYQIKTGDFDPSKKAEIKSILFRDKSTDLKPRVKSCLEKNGTLVIVLFGYDKPDRKDDQKVNLFRDTLKKSHPKFADAKIEILQQNQLAAFLKPFPSLTLKLKGLNSLPIETFKSWSWHDDMKPSFIKSPDFDQFAISIRDSLRSPGQARSMRVIGDPGIGKTRFILEALREDDLAPLVIYVKAQAFLNSDLLINYLSREDNIFQVIAVIDECNLTQRIEILNKLSNRSTRIRLITIYNEEESQEHNIYYPRVPQLTTEAIKQIILSYNVPADQVERWAQLAGSSPRFAHMIGVNLTNFPDDILHPVENIYNRIIAGNRDPNSEDVKQRKRVLVHLALFKRFGYESPFTNEAKTIAAIVEKADRDITLAKFQEIVRELRLLYILQGEVTLYITPPALHIKMWAEYWDTYGRAFDLEEFFKIVPDESNLRAWFYEMFRYAEESGVASRVVKDLLGEKGPFQNSDYLKKKLGAQLFLALAEAEPKSALECLKKTIGTWNKESLLEFIIGRREVVWALEKIAVWKDLFADAARLLLLLGEAENETWANNASGVFASLFTPGPGRVSPTEASPEERFPILRLALEAQSLESRTLGLRASNVALETRHFVRNIGAEYQGLRKEPQLWVPRTNEEIWNAYLRVWMLLTGRIEHLSNSERDATIEVLLQHARGLLELPHVAEAVLDTLKQLSLKSYTDKKKLLSTVIQILHYEKNLASSIQDQLKKLKDDLTGTDFSSLMKRYVGMNLLEDAFDNQDRPVDQAEKKIAELADYAIKNIDLLHKELPWLVTSEANRGFHFGYELGKNDDGFSLLSALLEAQRNANGEKSVYFLGGYFRAIYEKDPVSWEQHLDAIAEDQRSSEWVPELTWRSGMSDRAASRILQLAKSSAISIFHFRIFGLGSVLANLSENIFKEWVEYLLDNPEREAVFIALNLYNFFYIRKESKFKLPEELTIRLLLHNELFQSSDKKIQDHMVVHYWTEIGKAFVILYPEKSLQISDKILEHFGEDGTIVEGFFSMTTAVLNDIVQRFGGEVWKQIVRYLGPPIDTRAFHITQWLKGEESSEMRPVGGALPFIPVEDIWSWADQDTEKRAWYLATFVPNILFREEAKICLARELLVRYGAREDVRRNLISNFSSEGWVGPSSLHYKRKKQYIIDFLKGEDNENVKRWISEYVSLLEERITSSNLEEEREGF